jgi:hypothetical protein
MHGTTLEHEIAKFNEYTAERIAHTQKGWSKTEEERAARATANKKLTQGKAKAARAAARALKPVPSAEELAALAAARKARKKATARKHRVKVRDARRAEKALRDAPTIVDAQREISRRLASLWVGLKVGGEEAGH